MGCLFAVLHLHGALRVPLGTVPRPHEHSSLCLGFLPLFYINSYLLLSRYQQQIRLVCRNFWRSNNVNRRRCWGHVPFDMARLSEAPREIRQHAEGVPFFLFRGRR